MNIKPYDRANLSTPFALFFFIFLVPVSLLGDWSGIDVSLSFLLSWVVVAYSGARLAQFVSSGAKNLLDLTFWLFVYVWLGVTAMLQLGADSFPWAGSYSDSTTTLGVIVVLVGLIAYDAGRHIASLVAVRRVSWGAIVQRAVSKNRLLALSIFAITISGLIAAQVFSESGLLVSRTEMATLLAGGGEKSSLLIRMTLLTVPPFVALFLMLAQYRTLLTKTSFIVAAGILGVINLAVSNPIVAPRFWTGTIALSLLFIFYTPGRFRNLVLSTGLTTLLLVVFPYMDAFRHSLDATVVFRPLEAAEVIRNKGDYDAFQQVLNAVDHVQQHGATMGNQLLGTLLFWVPRSVWLDKPIGSGTLIATGASYDFTNLSAPLWTEFYIDFGAVGVIIGFLFYGYATTRLQDYARNSIGNSDSFGHALFILFAAFQIYLLRGELMNAFAVFFSVLIFLLIPTKRPNENKANSNAPPPVTI